MDTFSKNQLILAGDKKNIHSDSVTGKCFINEKKFINYMVF